MLHCDHTETGNRRCFLLSIIYISVTNDQSTFYDQRDHVVLRRHTTLSGVLKHFQILNNFFARLEVVSLFRVQTLIEFR